MLDHTRYWTADELQTVSCRGGSKGRASKIIPAAERPVRTAGLGPGASIAALSSAIPRRSDLSASRFQTRVLASMVDTPGTEATYDEELSRWTGPADSSLHANRMYSRSSCALLAACTSAAALLRATLFSADGVCSMAEFLVFTPCELTCHNGAHLWRFSTCSRPRAATSSCESERPAGSVHPKRTVDENTCLGRQLLSTTTWCSGP